MPVRLSELNQDFYHERTRCVQMLCPRSGAGSTWVATILLAAFIFAGLFGESGAAVFAVQQLAPSTPGPRAREVKHGQSNAFYEQELAVNVLKQVSSGEFLTSPASSLIPCYRSFWGEMSEVA